MKEKRSIFWEVIFSIIVRKKNHMNMQLILNGYRDGAVESTNTKPLFMVIRREKSQLSLSI
jgi:hypothetical protein